MDIKLIALDLDGTTLSDDKNISKGNREALTKAAEQGVNIVIATGRSFRSLPEAIFELPAIRYIITANGAIITDLKENKEIYKNCISERGVNAAIEMLSKHDFIIEAFADGQAYIESWYYDEVLRTQKSFKGVEYVLTTRIPHPDIYEFMREHIDRIENINVNFPDVSKKPAMLQEMLELPEVTLTSSFEHNIEIGGATTSKADALMHLCEILGVDPSEMMAAGDSPNDSAMLKIAGLPVAVGNAKDEVKAIARYIASANNEDGVADAINKFVLNEME